MRKGTPGLNAWESQPNPIRVSMVFLPVLERTLSLGAILILSDAQDSAGALTQVELGQLQVARLGNLQINLRTVHYGYWMSGALDTRGLVGADEAVRGGFGKRLLQEAVAEPLGGLRKNYEFAGDGGG